MKRYLFSIFLLVLVTGTIPVIALDGEVVTVNGKVEFQNNTGNWKSLRAGDLLTAGTIISTGFKSEATVKLGASILTIKPLTRMTLTQLVEKEDTPLGQTRTGTAGQQLELVGDSITSPVTALQTQMDSITLSATPSTEVKSAIMATSGAPAPVPPVITASAPVPTPPETITTPTTKKATLNLTIN